jgi:hydrogenase expression/formation protein
MDTCGYAKRRVTRGDPNLEQKLTDRILEIKDISRQRARDIASATIIEAHATLRPSGEILTPITSGVTMGKFVCRVEGRRRRHDLDCCALLRDV